MRRDVRWTTLLIYMQKKDSESNLKTCFMHDILPNYTYWTDSTELFYRRQT